MSSNSFQQTKKRKSEATKVLIGKKMPKPKIKENNMYAIKAPVFPFNKFPNTDVLLGPEMKSTGEVMGMDSNFGVAFAKSRIASGNPLPKKGIAILSVKKTHREEVVGFAKRLVEMDFKLVATRGTARTLIENGIKCGVVNKVREGSPNIVDALNSKKLTS